MFPEHNILPADQDSWFSKSIEQKLLEFTPYSMCSFYAGFTILQVYGEESKEYFFGNYFNGEYCGCIYSGDKFTHLEVAKICEVFMPKKIEDLKQYIIDFGDKVWYYQPPLEQYAWIFNRVLIKL